MSILILAEHDNSQLKVEFFKSLNAALNLAESVDVLVLGFNCLSVSTQANELSVVKQVYQIDDECFEHHSEEAIGQSLYELAKDYTHVISSSSSLGRSVMPRVAALLDVSPIGNVSEILSKDLFVRPTYAGRMLATVKSSDKIKVITVSASAFTAFSESRYSGNTKNPIVNLPISDNAGMLAAQFVSENKGANSLVSLLSAEVIVAAGRGLLLEDNYKKLEVFAEKLGAAVGATRAVVDLGWASNDKQIGQTAKCVAPQLYIALGVSGAPQHYAGMKDSKVVIAVNKDENAPIFNISDYGLVGDLNELLPELIDKIRT